MQLHYSGPAEALLAVVESDILTGRSAAERLVEADIDAAIDEFDAAARIRLAVAHLGRALERNVRRHARDPVRFRCAKACGKKGGMVAALDHDQHVSDQVLGGDEPGGTAGAVQAAYAETTALAERVALESAMPADYDTLQGLDRAGSRRKPCSNKFPEGALTDEADPGRVPLAGDREAAITRNGAHFGLPQSTDGEFAERQL